MSVINDISDVEHFNPRKIPNDELTFDWSLACAWYSDAKRLGKDFKYPMDTVLNIAEKILGEISQRVASGEMKMEFNTKTMKKDSKQLFNLTFRKLSEGKQKFIVCNDNAPQMPAIKATDFPSIVWIPDFISLAGSTLYAKGREPNDRDIIVRADSKDQNMFIRVDASLNVKLTRILDEIFKGEKNAPVQYSPSAYGPNTSYVPLYDLVLVPKDKLSITQVNEQDYADRFYDSADELVKPFTWLKQLKPMKGKFHGEAYTVESVLEVVKSRKTDWYQTGISVARKLDGVAIQCHTDGEGKVFIATEDGGDITSKLPTLVSLLRKVRAPSILIGELELYEGDKHVPRQGTIGLIHKNVVPEDEPNVVFTYYDCVYWDRDIHLSDYLTRLNAPRGLPIGKNFKKLEQIVVHTEQDLAREIKSAADKEGSEGAYMKLLSFKYELDGATLENIKYKRTRQIDVKVVKVHAVEGSDSTWNYLTTLEDGTPSGNTFNTGIKAEVGDVITVDFMNLSKYTDPKTGKSWYNFWAPSVIAKKESGKADNVQTAEELVVASKGSTADKTFPRRYVFNDVDQYGFVPSESKMWKGIAGLHLRGTSVHLDLRLQISDSELSGWTIYIPKGLSRPATSLSDAKELVNREIVPLIKETLSNPMTKFNGREKELEPIGWIDYEAEVEPGGIGATKNKEGFLVIIDEFQVQYGASKDDYHEYFVNGKIFDGRIVAVKIENKAEWEKTDEGIMTWMFFKTKTEIPYVITRRAVKKGWIPEHGFSALPREYRNKVPAVSRWWIAKEKDRLKLRDSYVESMKSSLVTDSVSGQFKLKKQIFRGPIVIRTGPSRIMYHLILKNKQGFQEFISDNELPDTGKFQQTTQSEWNATGVVPAKTELNPTKATHSEIEDIDGGPFRWLDKAKSIIKLEGKDFKGTFLFSKKEGSDSVQNMKRI
jgi:hypothetical protein